MTSSAVADLLATLVGVSHHLVSSKDYSRPDGYLGTTAPSALKKTQVPWQEEL